MMSQQNRLGSLQMRVAWNHHVILSSDHSHRGPDTTGAWGFLPPAYMGFVANQTREAVLAAEAAKAPARLKVAALDARDAEATVLLAEARAVLAQKGGERVDPRGPD
jgi:hypothetical protein